MVNGHKVNQTSIVDQIEHLARQTQAPTEFVDQVKQLFVQKGIPLDCSAVPYQKALDEAFTREKSIRDLVGPLRRLLAMQPKGDKSETDEADQSSGIESSDCVVPGPKEKQ